MRKIDYLYILFSLAGIRSQKKLIHCFQMKKKIDVVASKVFIIRNFVLKCNFDIKQQYAFFFAVFLQKLSKVKVKCITLLKCIILLKPYGVL